MTEAQERANYLSNKYGAEAINVATDIRDSQASSLTVAIDFWNQVISYL